MKRLFTMRAPIWPIVAVILLGAFFVSTIGSAEAPNSLFVDGATVSSVGQGRLMLGTDGSNYQVISVTSTGAIRIAGSSSGSFSFDGSNNLLVALGTVLDFTNDSITAYGPLVDNAAFTDGTTRVQPAGFIYDETAGTALTENDVAAARVDSKRAQVIREEGAVRGTYASSAGGVPGTATTLGVDSTSSCMSALSLGYYRITPVAAGQSVAYCCRAASSCTATTSDTPYVDGQYYLEAVTDAAANDVICCIDASGTNTLTLFATPITY